MSSPSNLQPSECKCKFGFRPLESDKCIVCGGFLKEGELVMSSLPEKPIEGIKDSNPKDAVGVRKAPVSTIPGTVIAELGIAMLEGARKYGRHNYRVVGVRASVYRDAAWRHLNAWWEGEDIDPDSGLSHITKAIASLTVLRDAMICEKLTDDRPPKAPEGFLKSLNEQAAKVIDKYTDAKLPYTELK